MSCRHTSKTQVKWWMGATPRYVQEASTRACNSFLFIHAGFGMMMTLPSGLLNLTDNIGLPNHPSTYPCHPRKSSAFLAQPQITSKNFSTCGQLYPTLPSSHSPTPPQPQSHTFFNYFRTLSETPVPHQSHNTPPLSLSLTTTSTKPLGNRLK